MLFILWRTNEKIPTETFLESTYCASHFSAYNSIILSFSSLRKSFFSSFLFIRKTFFWLTMLHDQGVTKRCRLSLLTNSALVYRSSAGGWGVGSQPMSTAVHITWHGAQTNFGDLPPYLNRGIFWIFFLQYVLYSTLLRLPPLRFHCVGGC